MKGGYRSKSETGPTITQGKGLNADHGAGKLASMVKNFPADGSPKHGTFLADDSDYSVDRKNGPQPSTATPTADKRGITAE